MLREKILAGEGPRLYGISPPKANNSPERNREIAARQAERINALNADGVIIYDVQNEPGRTGAPRPFPFLPALDPLEYARDYLAGITAPKILYKSVGGDTEAAFGQWLAGFAEGENLAVFVGASTSGGEADRLSLRSACRLARASYPMLCFGGVAIAERHLEKGDEDQRLLSKEEAGCGFFVSQTVYDVQATKSLISDYTLRFTAAGRKAPPLIFSFAPCGSLKTMEFMQWLGIRFPRWLENELRHSRDILERSIDLCVEVASELSAFARAKGVAAGMNVESVSIRKEEIEASSVLFRRLADGPFARQALPKPERILRA
jgi:hypothetical protein